MGFSFYCFYISNNAKYLGNLIKNILFCLYAQFQDYFHNLLYK